METKGCFRLCFLWQRAHTAWTMGFWLKSRKREAGLQGSGISSRIAHAWKHVRVCFCAFHVTEKIASTPVHTHRCTVTQTGANLQLPLVCLSATIVIVFSCLHTSIIYFQMKLGEKHGRKCCTVICICIRINTWLITIYYVFSGQAHSWAEKVPTCTWGA